ncbi:MAG: hypothetical protein WC683_01075 [bacterium]
MSEVYPYPTWAEVEAWASKDPIVDHVLRGFRGTLVAEKLLILMVVELARDRERLVRELTMERMRAPVPTKEKVEETDGASECYNGSGKIQREDFSNWKAADNIVPDCAGCVAMFCDDCLRRRS